MKTIIRLATLLGVVVFALILSGCATPQPVSRLYPIEKIGTKKWSYGNEMITLSAQEGIQVSGAFRRSMPGYLVFEVNVRNASGKPVLVTPEQFYYEALAADTATVITTKTYANDPEKTLLEMDIAESRMNAEQQNALTSELISTTLDIADDVTDRQETVEQRQQEYTEREARRAEYEGRQANYNIQFRSLDEERRYWADHAIRRNTLEPGYEMTGSVFFPRNNQAKFIRVNFVIEDKTFPFLFWQVLYKP